MIEPELHIDDHVNKERDKYHDIWAMPGYSEAASPGEIHLQRFLDILKPPTNSRIIDLGCGHGKAGLALHQRGFDVTWVDLVDVLDPKVPRERFIECPLWVWKWGNRRLGWDYGYCCDVMEHLPTEYVMLALERITCNCRITWFSICLRADHFGGGSLHLTVRPFTWWLSRLADMGNVVDARDCLETGIYVVES